MVLVLLSFASPTYAKDAVLHYDTSKCSTDPHDMVYFAVGRRVYRQPMENIFYIQGYSNKLRDDAHLPQPPKPSDPAGCPDHPIQALGYYLRHFSALPGDTAKSLYANADKVPIEIINNPSPGLNAVDTKSFDLICKTYHLHDDSVPGFIGCKKPFKCDHGEIYQAKKYSLPFHQRMILNCVVSYRYCEPQPGLCSVSYRLFDDLTVWYKFKTVNVPIKDALDYDRELQRRIGLAEVKNYPWPSDRPNNPTRRQP